MKRTLDICGSRFGDLRVLKHEGSTTDQRALWRCICVCGSFRVVAGSKLRDRTVTHCGCKKIVGNLRHGLYLSVEYRTLHGMMGRCYNPKNQRFSYYGGRGITVCDRWKDAPDAFIEDMGLRPSSKHSIERIDNSKGYSPENRKWATHTEQGRNRRTTVKYIHDGIEATLPEWAERLGMPLVTLRKRLQAGRALSEVLHSGRLARR